MSLKIDIAGKLRPNNKTAFIQALPANAKVFDIGCGNRSAEQFKAIKSDLHYTGIDIGDYNQSSTSFVAMDNYICVPPEQFAQAIANVGTKFDAVVSSHNIEHCDKPSEVISAMCSVLKPGGKLYFSFPSEATVNFPSRVGTLNFYDDPTHQKVPDFDMITRQLKDEGMNLDVVKRRNRPLVHSAAGLLMEPWSALTKKVDSKGAIWALWGFESVIWASRK